jgi:photosystem II stability/assembly factor-like uncharacterized protein
MTRARSAWSLLLHRTGTIIALICMTATAAGATAGGGARVPVISPMPGVALEPGTAGCAPIGPLSATFVSASAGWVLGSTSGGCSGAARMVLRKTIDGGRTWFGGPAPPGGVNEVLFADLRDGWVFGPGLWATHDGGASWHQVPTHGASVYSLHAAGGYVVAAFARCGSSCDAARFAVYTSPASADRWTPAPGATGTGDAQVAVAGESAYVVSSARFTSAVTLLTGPADGSARWRRLAVPCPAGWLAAVAAGTTPGLVVACAPIGYHPTPTQVYQSADAGAGWRRLAGLSLEDSVSAVSLTPDGTILVGGAYTGMMISRDGGRTWHAVPAVDDTDAVQGGGSFDATMTGNEQGFAIVAQQRLWLTHDGGRTWTPVTLR